MTNTTCSSCTAEVDVNDAHCERCGAELGYFPHALVLHAISPSSVDAAYSFGPDGRGPLHWRCLNFAWGCNWMVPCDSGAIWCASCALTRGRPDLDNLDAVAAWCAAERSKRQLVAQLLSLRLPVEPRTADGVNGLCFDLVYLPEGPGVTGHLDGVVTVDLREADARYREQARNELGESSRTLLGHLRHEMGHYYWTSLVGGTGSLGEFRSLFGDERIDYAASLTRHYEEQAAEPSSCHVSAYAASHPHEDWAETFAHFLHIIDGVETAEAHGFAPLRGRTRDFGSLLASWRRISRAVNAINASLGHEAAYPFEITPVVAEKLAFVHRQVVQSHAWA